MDDIIFVTADSVRRDFLDAMPFCSDLDVHDGVAVSQYTRPSLASIHSSNYLAPIQSKVVEPSLATVLDQAGYTCIGLSPNPNTHATFGFGSGFSVYDSYVEPGNRGSSLRQYLARSDLLRRIYYKFYPPHAKSEGRPADSEVIERAISEFNEADSPRFLWVHLMESHRPYGRGETAISKELDQKAFFSPDDLTEGEQDEILSAYRDALDRVDDNVRTLLGGVDGDPSFVFTSDHGEEFGDDGYYYHQPQRRRLDDVLIDVPVATRGFSIEDGPWSLIDVAPTIVAQAGIDPPTSWHGNDRMSETTEFALSIAPWNDRATMAWQDFSTKVVAHDATMSYSGDVEQAGVSGDVPEELEENLRDLGYLT